MPNAQPRPEVPESYVRSAFNAMRPRLERSGAGPGDAERYEAKTANSEYLVSNAVSAGAGGKELEFRRLPDFREELSGAGLRRNKQLVTDHLHDYYWLIRTLNSHPGLVSHAAGKRLSPGQISAIKGVIRSAYRLGLKLRVDAQLQNLEG